MDANVVACGDRYGVLEMGLQHERIGPPEAFGAPPRTGRFWFDFLAASAAIFISVISLVVAIRGERTQRDLLAANSWPFVQLSEDNGLANLKLDVENAGVGPAKIMTFEVFYKRQPVNGAVDLLQKCCGLAAAAPGALIRSIPGFSYGGVYNNVLRPGEHIISLELKKGAASDPLYSRFAVDMPNLSFRTCYCSVLGECWTSNLRDLTQNPVRSCPTAAHPFDTGMGN
jgi:hypothetical protein